MEKWSSRQSVTLEVAGPNPVEAATADSAATNIDVPVKIRPGFLDVWQPGYQLFKYLISQQGCWYLIQPRVLLAEAFYWVKKIVLHSIIIWPETR